VLDAISIGGREVLRTVAFDETKGVSGASNPVVPGSFNLLLPLVVARSNPVVKRGPLLDAVLSNDLTAVSQLLAAGVSTHETTVEGGTPLWAAAHDGRAEIVALLLAACADANSRKNSGATALFVACQNGHAAVVSALIAAGADCNASRVTDSAAPITIAAEFGYTDCVSALLAADGVLVDQPAKVRRPVKRITLAHVSPSPPPLAWSEPVPSLIACIFVAGKCDSALPSSAGWARGRHAAFDRRRGRSQRAESIACNANVHCSPKWQCRGYYTPRPGWRRPGPAPYFWNDSTHRCHK
jgi:hypothetical protein